MDGIHGQLSPATTNKTFGTRGCCRHALPARGADRRRNVHRHVDDHDRQHRRTGRGTAPAGSTLSFVGQTAPDLAAYRSQVLSDPSFPRPDGITVCTTIVPGVCDGLTARCDLNGNVTDLPASLAQHPGAAIAVGLYLADGPGCYNQPLRALAGRQVRRPDSARRPSAT